MRRKAIAVFVFFIETCCFSQYYSAASKDAEYFLEKAIIDTYTYHSSIKPIFGSDLNLDSSKIEEEFRYKKRVSDIKPLVSIGYSIDKSGISYQNELGGSFYVQLLKKVFIYADLTADFNKYPNFIEEKIDSVHIAPFLGRINKSFSKNHFLLNFKGSFTYSPKKYLDLVIGHDKVFLGDGYRSLLLSSSSSPYTFAGLSLHAWRLKYWSMWTYLPDLNQNAGNAHFYSKYGSFHFLSVNVTNRLNLGFFESIISWASDTSTNRGLELTYLNPFIFYRPIEYAMHSPDNALMAGSFKLRLWKKTYFYSQLFLDDLMVKELFTNKGWFGNKYAIQAGYKSYNFLTIENLFIQQEINYVRPYVYSHSEANLNYGVEYQALAHPFGANFQELLSVFRFSKKKWYFSGFVSVAQIGLDSSKTSYGQNIHKTTWLRPYDYGVTQLQGLKTNQLISQLAVNYKIGKVNNYYIFASIHYRKQTNEIAKTDNMLFSIGIKTLINSNDFDY